MKPAWDQLGEEFKGHKTKLIGDVDCTSAKGKAVCSEVCYWSNNESKIRLIGLLK